MKRTRNAWQFGNSQSDLLNSIKQNLRVTAKGDVKLQTHIKLRCDNVVVLIEQVNLFDVGSDLEV